MKFNIIGYLIGEGFRNTFKNKKSTFSAMLVMCISMLIFGLFFVLGENINHIMGTVEDAQAIQVFIEDGTTDEEIELLGEQIKKINGVDSSRVQFLSREEGFEKYLEKYGDKAYLLEPYADVIPDSYIINFTDLSLAQEVETAILALDNVKKVTSANETVQKLASITSAIRIVTIAILAGLVIGAIFIISNTIKLTVYARRKEISIMKYVGATNSFIRGPFLVEGIIIGFIAACITIVLITFVYDMVVTSIEASQVLQKMNITLLQFADLAYSITLVYAILGVGVGIIGSSISMKKYLEV